MKAYVTLGELFSEPDDLLMRCKIALLWFDNLLIQSFPNNFYVDYLLEEYKISNKYERFLREFIIDYPETIDIYKQQSKNNKLLNVTDQVLRDYFEGEYIGKERDIFLEKNCITYGVEKWAELNMTEPYAFIGRKVEQKIIRNTFFEKNGDKEDMIEFVNMTLPNLKNMSFEKIIEMRNHPYLESFRITLNELHQNIKDTDKLNVQELFLELVNKNIKEVFSLFKPSVSKQMIKGIVCNLPMPIPVNPISIIASMGDVAKDIKLKNTYGWLFFYMDNFI